MKSIYALIFTSIVFGASAVICALIEPNTEVRLAVRLIVFGVFAVSLISVMIFAGVLQYHVDELERQLVVERHRHLWRSKNEDSDARSLGDVCSKPIGFYRRNEGIQP